MQHLKRGFSVGSLTMIMTMAVSPVAEANTPDRELPRELQTRLMQPPECAPRCAELVAADVDVAVRRMGHDAAAVGLLVLLDLDRLDAGLRGGLEDRLGQRVVGMLLAVRRRLEQRRAFDALRRHEAADREPTRRQRPECACTSPPRWRSLPTRSS